MCLEYGKNEVAYGECSWITQVVDDVSLVRNFIISHSLKLTISNHYSPLKLLAVVETCITYVVVMLKRFILNGSL